MKINLNLDEAYVFLAYQLQVLDDDDDFKPFAFEPLDPQRKLSSYDSDFLDSLVISLFELFKN